MDSHDIIELVIAVVGFIVTSVVTLLASKFRDLQNHVRAVERESHELKVAVASDYVKKSELSNILKEISGKLDKLETLEVSMAKHYATREDMRDMGERLDDKLEYIIKALGQKADVGSLGTKIECHGPTISGGCHGSH